MNFLKALVSPFGAVVDLGASMLGLPDSVKNVAKVAVGAVTGNFVTVAEGAVGVAIGLVKGDSAKTEYASSSSEACYRGYAPTPKSAEDSNKKLRDAACTLRLYFKEVDRGAGENPIFGQGRITRDDLAAAARRSDLPDEVRDAALTLLKNSELFDSIDAARTGKKDGKVSVEDLDQVLSRLGPEPEAPSSSRGQGSSGSCGPSLPGGEGGPCTAPRCSEPSRPSGSPTRSILNDPCLSTEEKIQALLGRISDNTDAEILEVMEEMARVSDEQAGVSGSDAAAQKKNTKLNSSMEQLQLKLQKLTERRKQMFDL
ncbi:MAG TPA: hypothetical protein VEY30_14015, partial [Myxococcaceae bacterium]|nr:hypothetical protein [Myxococcaceae bacterium]